jgi:cephalosporin hydroxylase
MNVSNPVEAFQEQVAQNVTALGRDPDVQALSRIWSRETNRYGYSYNFSWLGRPIIQYPQDLIAMQELTWSIQPDLIIETGIAHGGSLIFSASMLELNAACGGPQNASVLGIDIDIRAHNREAIESHPMCKRISMLQGSSVAPQITERVKAIAAANKKVLVYLDSNHTHEHVLAELRAYAPLTSVGSYCVVFDTVIEDMSGEMFADRPWGPGSSPKTAVREYLAAHPEFEIDKKMDHKLLISVAPDGYLRRVA